MATDPASKRRELRRFVDIGETPAHAFERMLSRGSDALAHAPYQFKPAVADAVRELRIDAASGDGMEFETCVTQECGVWRVRVDWFASRAKSERLGNRELALLQMDLLLAHVEKIEWRNLGSELGGPSPAPEAAVVAYRDALYREFLHKFYIAFVLPQLYTEGVSRIQRKNASGRGNKMRAYAKELKDKGMLRPAAVKDIAAKFDVSNQRAGSICIAILWRGTQGRPRGKTKRKTK